MTFGALFNLSAAFQPITAENFTSGTAFIGWEYVHPASGTYEFDEYDHDFGFGAAHGLQLTASPLVWGYKTPDWVRNEPDMQALMVEHITQVMKRYQSVDRWVVYGEANHRGRDIFWNQPGPHGGMQAVRDAFATARSMDPEAVLIYNDYDTYDGVAWEDRMPTFEAVVSQIQADGNLDGIGLQVTGRMNTFSVDRLASTLGVLGEYGLPVYVTEFSIMIDGPNSPENLLRQAQVAEETVYVLRQSGVVADMTAWGLEDSLTNKMYIRNANAGLWLETAQGMFTPKPIVFTIMRALVK
jgi:endo-1,4-beta-xylanase